ncbi:uncharacterized protein LOC111056061 [Nilaparvata lugens]|uniref:uncharacterized protein LOC111056061 n=1 Tax=Nilaparvata lugens TaxID=108931 RepID=UPI00193DDA97|nr:uncharacterized protein LOC111056061 [Nilaparvata lugens]
MQLMLVMLALMLDASRAMQEVASEAAFIQLLGGSVGALYVTDGQGDPDISTLETACSQVPSVVCAYGVQKQGNAIDKGLFGRYNPGQVGFFKDGRWASTLSVKGDLIAKLKTLTGAR